jgi:hypothetical protein
MEEASEAAVDFTEKAKETTSSSTINNKPVIPFVPLIQSGFEGAPMLKNSQQHQQQAGRFLIAFASSTYTATVTSTYVYILTATCKSTTFYPNCGTGATNIYSGGK